MLCEKDGRALLADQPGLGKTVQVIGWLALNPEVRPAIIVCPAVAKHHWANTARRWLKDDKIIVLSGKTSNDLPEGTVFIVNFDVLANLEMTVHGKFSFLRYPDAEHIKINKQTTVEIPYTGWVDYLYDLRAPFIAIDESQRVANHKSQRTRAISRLIKGKKHLICTSGTPSENRPIELFNTISWITPHLFPNKWTYQIRYCGGKHTGFGWNFSGASNIPELHKILTDHIMIRRTKKEVMGDLPPKIRSIVPLDITNRREYSRAEDDFVKWMRQKGRPVISAEHFVKMEVLKQLAVKGKIKQVLSWIEEYLDTGEKLVVFAEHKAVVKAIIDKFGKIAVKVDGSVSTKQRQEAERRFQEDATIRLFVGNIEAAGVSLTLTAANAVAMIEMPKTPAKLEQCEDRVYGRINDCHGATIYFLVAVDTIEEKLAELLDTKAKVLMQMFDGKDITEENLLVSLIKKFI